VIGRGSARHGLLRNLSSTTPLKFMPKHTLLVAALSVALATPLTAFADAAPDAAATGDSKTLAAVRVTGS
ncbi:hypothetical protein DSJ19_00885, partial [Mycobacterium tuberculosis]